jgi:hypothetical protein
VKEPPSKSTALHHDPEVRAYLKRLLSAIFLGLVIVIATVVWAWNEYGTRMKDRPPLPPPAPHPALNRGAPG